MNTVSKTKVGPAFSLLLFAALAAIVLAAGLAAEALPAEWQGFRADTIVARQAHFADRFFPWDAHWYERAAREGYHWLPGASFGQQAVAFFPLWPMILRAVTLTGLGEQAQRWVVVALAAGMGWASIFAMHRFAARLLAPAPARTAVILYAFYPGAGFLLKSYPTGLQNLLTILCLSALCDGRLMRAALCSLMATACGPLGVALGVTVSITAALRARAPASMATRVRLLAQAGALGLLAVGGLLGFMLFQWAALGSPFAFMAAQWAWHPAAPLAVRIVRAFFMVLGVPDLVLAAARLPGAFALWRAGALADVQQHLQNGLNMAALGVAILASLAGSLPRFQFRFGVKLPLPVLLQGWAVLALYVWFVGSVIDGWATLRLIYPAIVPFLVLAAGRGLRRPWLAMSVLLLVLEEFMQAAGYLVI